jgi:hypothetical protein
LEGDFCFVFVFGFLEGAGGLTPRACQFAINQQNSEKEL